MLSNHLQNGMETARLVWSRLPNSEDGEFDSAGISKKSDGCSVESLDYEVIENFAYREDQVNSLSLLKINSLFAFDPRNFALQ